MTNESMMSNKTTVADIRLLLVPGGGNSGPDHWHTYWESEDRRMERVVQEDWNGGTRDQWVNTLDQYVQSSDKPVIFVAHSLGSIAVSHWSATHSGPVVGGLLVAPTDVEGDWVISGSVYEGFRPVCLESLPFPTVLVASTNDPFVSVDRAREFADAWGSKLHIAGPLGHIGSDSKLGFWLQGRQLLENIVQESRSG